MINDEDQDKDFMFTGNHRKYSVFFGRDYIFIILNK